MVAPTTQELEPPVIPAGLPGRFSPPQGNGGREQLKACIQRKDGFKKAVLEKVPGAEWIADQAGFEPGKSTETATTMLTGDTTITAMFATTDNGTIGAIQGVLATGRQGKIVVFGNDISVWPSGILESWRSTT